MLFPTDATDLPSPSMTVAFCAAFGAATVGLGQLIQNRPLMSRMCAPLPTRLFTAL